MAIFSRVSDLFKVKQRTEYKNKFYNQLERIIDRASKKDYAYLIESRKFVENILKETFGLIEEKNDLDSLINENIVDSELKSRLHNLRIKANDMVHSIEYQFKESEIFYDLKIVDDLIDYCCFKNEKINEFELFSLIKRIDEEPKIDDDKIYST